MKILQTNYEWDLLEIMLVEFSIANYGWYLPEIYQLKIDQDFSGKIWVIFARCLSIDNWSSCIGQNMIDICLMFFNWKLIKFYRVKYDLGFSVEKWSSFIEQNMIDIWLKFFNKNLMFLSRIKRLIFDWE